MAQPTIPLEIWAYENYTLPNTQEPNKERPINDLWKKGYDLGEKPACEEHNYLFNMFSQWISYINKEQIPGLDSKYLKIASNLADVPNKEAARINLDVFGKAEADSRFVNVSGDTMTGPLNIQRINLTAAASDQAFIQGTIAGDDTTFLDFWIGDNPGPTDGNGVDRMRWCFQGTGYAFEMMNLNALNSNTSRLGVTGQLWVRDRIDTGTIAANDATFNNLTVNNNYAVVGGRHVARTVNGYGADANGNINLPLPQQGVLDIRLSGMGSVSNVAFTNEGSGRRASAPDGSVLVSLADAVTKQLWLEDVDIIYYRYIQKNINGVWYNVGTL